MADRLLKYADLLREYQNPDAREVRKFVARHADDEVFAGRVKKLNALFLLQMALAVPDEAEAPPLRTEEPRDRSPSSKEVVDIGIGWLKITKDREAIMSRTPSQKE